MVHYTCINSLRLIRKGKIRQMSGGSRGFYFRLLAEQTCSTDIQKQTNIIRRMSWSAEFKPPGKVCLAPNALECRPKYRNVTVQGHLEIATHSNNVHHDWGGDTLQLIFIITNYTAYNNFARSLSAPRPGNHLVASTMLYNNSALYIIRV